MSRVDEALRRAVMEGPSIHAPTVVEQAAVPVDESALNGYARERQHPEQTRRIDRPQARPNPDEGADPRPAARPSRSSPEARPPDRPMRYHASLEGKAVCSRETVPISVEQYRRLAATLVTIQAERGLKSVMISSAMPSEGKTLTATNLALTLSEAYGRRVLLVDADFRRPCVHEMFGIANVTGLAEGLQSTNRSPSLVPVSATLSIVPSGHPGADPMAALSSERMRTFVAEAAQRFDWVLIDTPPVGLLSDAHLIARVTDGVLFVVAAGLTPHAVVQRCIEDLGADRVIGIVLNRASDSALKVQDYYGSYYRKVKS